MLRSTIFASLLFASAGTAALAQPAATASSEPTTLGELVVTAQRQEQRLQDVPVAVTAFDQQALENRSIETLDSVAKFTPNVRFDGAAPLSGGGFNATVFIRGVGQNDFAIFADPGVGIYVDDVYYARSIGGVLDAIDLQSVQVLRGPQGTLFGKNTIGGAVLVTTRKPVDELTGEIEVTGGRFDRIDVRGVLNVPIVEGELAARLSVASLNRDGFVERLSDGSDQGDRNTDFVRGQLRWTPSDRVTVDLGADYTRSREHQAQNKLIAVAPAPGLTGVPFMANWNRFIAPTKGIVAPNGQPTVNPSWVTADDFTTWATGPNINNLDLWGVQAVTSVELAENLELKSVTAYRDMHAEFARDGDNTPFTFRETYNDENVWQFSQELQLNGRSFGGRVNWVAGAYLFKEKGSDIGRADLAPGLQPPLPPPFSPAQAIQNYITNKSWAVFGQANVALNDLVSVTLGGRYNQDDKTLRIYDVFDRQAPTPFVDVTREDDWSAFTPRLGIEVKPNADLLLYGSYSKGFKSGGFNARPIVSAAEVTPYEPETAITYELGAKTSWLNRRLILNGAVYWTEYENIQLTVNQTPQNFVSNAAKARIRGFELEGAARPTSWLELNAALGYTDAEYTEIGTGNPLQVLPITLASSLAKTPEWSVSAGAQITHAAGDAGDLVWRADVSHSSSYFNDVGNIALVAEDGYTLVNARVTFNSVGRRWKVSAFVTNLTDARYYVSGNASPAFGLAEVAYGRPREWGVTVGYGF